MVTKKKCPNCPHPLHGLHNKRTGKCKLCKCEGPNSTVKGDYVSDLVPKKKAEPRPKKVEPLRFVSLEVSDFGSMGAIGSVLSEEMTRLANKKRRK